MKLDRQAVRRQFGRAAASYDANAVVQYEVGKRLRGRLDGLRFEPSRVLDLGCGTGTQSRALHQRYPDAQIVALDSAPAMLARAQKQRGRWRRRFECIQADAEALPLAEAGFDLGRDESSVKVLHLQVGPQPRKDLRRLPGRPFVQLRE